MGLSNCNATGFEKCDVDDPFYASVGSGSISSSPTPTIPWERQVGFLCWTKTPPKPGSSSNPDDGKEGDDVNLECKTAKAPFASLGKMLLWFQESGKPCRTLWTEQTCISLDSPARAPAQVMEV